MHDDDTRSQAAVRGGHKYTAALAGAIERKWQDYWERHQTFHAPNPGEPGFDATRPKKVVMDMFPYPSGVGLHVGHPVGYIGTDIYARFLRMQGYNVVHPMGFDAFGLPAEQFAIQHKKHPRVTTEENIANIRVQMRRLGLGHDPKRFLATTDVEFYKWTQWIFLQIYGAWYDSAAGKARPIRDLVLELEAGKRGLPPEFAARSWSSLSEIERRKAVDAFRLAYVAELPVNWCPGLGTVLANEEVTADGRSERGDFPVYKRPLKQWMMRITSYCERLLTDLEPLDWPEPIKLMQRNWIGRSDGARVDFFGIVGSPQGSEVGSKWLLERAKTGWKPDPGIEPSVIRVFTTRPDTLYGATYMVLAPEHPLVDRLAATAWPSGFTFSRGRFPGAPGPSTSPREWIAAYRRYAESRSEVDRQVEAKEKTGVFTGSHALNPVNGEKIPVFIADYVLMGYGTGAIMAVPAHDERDFEFAKQLGLPIRTVVRPRDGAPGGDPGHAFAGDGISVASAVIEGLPTSDAKRTIVRWLEERGLGEGAVNYRLRDWLFSRQRYWGEPFPIVYDDTGLPLAVPESDLPVVLPEMTDYTPETTDDPSSSPRPPLARARDWTSFTRGAKRYTRELNTMPNWAGSCWYYLRYWDPRNAAKLVDPAVERYWALIPQKKEDHPATYDPGRCEIGAVDLYVGGAEHAVLHLLYSRFWHKVLFDLGHVSTPEPFQRLFNQGYILAAAYRDERGAYVEASKVVDAGGSYLYEGKPVEREFGKMGKSLKNAISPDEICDEYGADTLRLYEMYMGPLDESKAWNTRDIIGVHRFLQRVWRNFVDEDTGALRITDAPADDATRRLLHAAIDGVRRDLESLRFNTAIAKLIELNNELVPRDSLPREVADALTLLLAPLVPHFAEELWSRLGGTESLAHEPFPAPDPRCLVEAEVEVPVMIEGKLRAKLKVRKGTDLETLKKLALSDPKVMERLRDQKVAKVIIVPDRMVNIVLG